MSLTGRAVQLLALLLTVAVPALALLLWTRVRGPAVFRVGQRLGLVLLAQSCAVLLTFVTVNDQYGFYASWQDLLGVAPAPGHIDALTGVAFTGPWGRGEYSKGRVTRTADGGQLLALTVQGDASGITSRVLVHLPGGYDSSRASYPVLELISGWRGEPETWTHTYRILDAMLSAQHRGNLGKVITVIPSLNVALPRDVECTNVPRGPQAETWLTSDVRDLVTSQYRALQPARDWAVMGYSTGGYCAAKMLLHRPSWFGSAVSLGGYFEAVKDNTTGDLWGGSTAIRDANSPLWLVSHHRSPPGDLLAYASRQDTESYHSTERFLSAARAPLRTYGLIAAKGGHNSKALAKAIPEVLDWLGAHLGNDQCDPCRHAPPAGSSVRPSKGPVQVKVHHRPRPSEAPQP